MRFIVSEQFSGAAVFYLGLARRAGEIEQKPFILEAPILYVSEGPVGPDDDRSQLVGVRTETDPSAGLVFRVEDPDVVRQQVLNIASLAYPTKMELVRQCISRLDTEVERLRGLHRNEPETVMREALTMARTWFVEHNP